MIDWGSAGFGAAWILGLSVILAAASAANYLAQRERKRLRDAIGAAGCQVALNLGLALFCVGWLGSAETAWERALWGILTISFVGQACLAERARRVRDDA